MTTIAEPSNGTVAHQAEVADEREGTQPRYRRERREREELVLVLIGDLQRLRELCPMKAGAYVPPIEGPSEVVASFAVHALQAFRRFMHWDMSEASRFGRTHNGRSYHMALNALEAMDDEGDDLWQAAKSLDNALARLIADIEWTSVDAKPYSPSKAELASICCRLAWVSEFRALMRGDVGDLEENWRHTSEDIWRKSTGGSNHFSSGPTVMLGALVARLRFLKGSGGGALGGASVG